ncbi:class A beta-lactamase [Cellulomonas sp. zg-ZUI40]|nr:class A beta-lactamase [Cellulomonas dongxiuzhuiae]
MVVVPRTPSPCRALAVGPLLALLVTGCAVTPEVAPTTAGSAGSTPAASAPAPAPAPAPTPVPLPLGELEARYDARVGVHAVDTGTGAAVVWRDDERFAYASTIKALAAGALLDLVGVDGLGRQVPVEADDLVVFSPVTETRVGGTMTLAEVAEAAVTRSDNTAGNLLLEALGGPAALDAALAALGDDVTVVSRTEPDLNEAARGDERDTTTPRTLAEDLRAYVLGDTLGDEERAVLTAWLTGTRTGDTLVRARLPADWVVGDKSGAAGYGTRNDVAVVWPTGGAPIVVAVMSDRADRDAEHDDALVAEAASAAVAALGRG